MNKVLSLGVLVVGLWLAGCSQPLEGIVGGKKSGGGVTYTFTTPAQYRETVPLRGRTITGNAAYYYPVAEQPPEHAIHYKGVFVEGRTVTLSPFSIARYETTYELWYEVKQWATDTARGADRYTFANQGWEGNDGTIGADPTEEAKTEPVTHISWRDTVVWCNAYSEISGKEPVYRNESNEILRDSTAPVESLVDPAKCAGKNGYRLPTEAEWEYAARGGGEPSTGGVFAYKWAGTNAEEELVNYAWYYENAFAWYFDTTKGQYIYDGNPNYGTHPVGTRTPNDAQLYDMNGNVREWCWDWYGEVSATEATDPGGADSGFDRVLRGGAWSDEADGCNVMFRFPVNPDDEGVYDMMGFRVVCGQ
jgi:formylglycine-generating enzyme required for sulfatase activity